MSKPSFNKLYEQSLQLTSHIDTGDGFLLQRNVEQLDQTSKKLVSKASKLSGDIAKNKAHYLLAGKGFDADKLARNLNSINIKAQYEPVEPITETDLEGYLKHEYDLSILTAIEEAKTETENRNEEKYETRVTIDWEDAKRSLLLSDFRTASSTNAPSSSSIVTATPSKPSFFSSPISSRFPSTNGTNKQSFSNIESGIDIIPSSSNNTSSTTTWAIGKSSKMDSKMIKYSSVISNVIYSRLKDSAYAILSALSEVITGSTQSNVFSTSAELESSRRTELLDSWEILRYMVNEEQTIHGEFQRSSIKEQAHFSMYQSSNIPSPKLQLQMISGALHFLENQYVKYMKNQVSSNPTKSNVGPVPSPRNLIRGFLHVKYNIGSNRSGFIEQEWPPELELVEGYPIWAEIYYCLRSGNTDEVKAITSSSKPEVVASLGKFPIYLSEYLKSPDRKISESKWQEMIQEYKLIVSRSTGMSSTVSGGMLVDPYKIALYNIIARCEQNKSFPHVFSTTQDFIWFKLSMVIISTGSESTPSSSSILSTNPSSVFSNFMYPLNKLQSLITQYGPDHFNKSGRNPLLYFQLLLLTQQFELAIIYLSKIDLYFVDSIHFAIGIYYYGILRTPFSLSSASLPSVDIVALLRQYVGQFTTTNSEDALYYYSIIREDESIRQYQIQSRTSSFSNATSSLSFNLSQQVEESDLSTSIGARDACIKDLILESRDFDFLIGINPFLQTNQPLSKSSNKIGKIEELYGKKKREEISRNAGNECLLLGKYEDAVMLFILCGDYDRVIQIFNSLLSRVVAIPTTPTPSSSNRVERDRVIALVSKYTTNPQQSQQSQFQSPLFQNVKDKRLTSTFEQLLKLTYFFDLYHSGRLIDALQHMEVLQILPANVSEVEKRVESFKIHDNSFKQNISDILLATMDILFKLYGNLKSSSVGYTSSKTPQSPANTVFGKEDRMNEIRSKAKALVMFANMIQFRMDPNTITQLLRLEVFMS